MTTANQPPFSSRAVERVNEAQNARDIRTHFNGLSYIWALGGGQWALRRSLGGSDPLPLQLGRAIGEAIHTVIRNLAGLTPPGEYRASCGYEAAAFVVAAAQQCDQYDPADLDNILPLVMGDIGRAKADGSDGVHVAQALALTELTKLMNDLVHAKGETVPDRFGAACTYIYACLLGAALEDPSAYWAHWDAHRQKSDELLEPLVSEYLRATQNAQPERE